MNKLAHQVPKKNLKNPVRIGVFKKDMPGRVTKAQEIMKGLDRAGHDFFLKNTLKLMEIFVEESSLTNE